MFTEILLAAVTVLAPVTATAHTPAEMPPLTRYQYPDDHRGYEKSHYRGKYWVKADEYLRRCIVARESHATYMLSNGGAYQFMSGWRPISGAWMLRRETRETYGKKDADRMFNVLSTRPFNEWSRYWQDALYSTVMNWEHRRSGWKHWAPTVPGTGCY